MPACGRCQRENPSDASFCAGCGSKLARVCPSCERENDSDANFCNGCGQTLVELARPASKPSSERSPRDYTPKHLADEILRSKSALEGERKHVTVLFADVKSSMEMSEHLDPEVWHGILDRFFEVLADGVHRFEGTVNQYTGDGIMALFGAPISHEDHPQRACYAALWLREALETCAREVKREHGIGLATRIGLHSGEVVVGKIGDDLRADYTAQGHTVGLAQRMESLAAPNTCYLSDATAKQVSGYFDLEDLGTFPVKGVSEPVDVFELRGTGELQTRFDVSRARGLSRFVGRDADMQALDSALAQAHSGSGQVVGIVAEAGTGKSRLCFEFIDRCRAQGMTVLEGRAVAHGKDIPLLPILQVFRAYYGIGERDDDRSVREKIAGRLLLLDEEFREVLPVMFEFFGVPDPDRPMPRMDPDVKQRQIFAVLRKLVGGADENQRFVALLEDLHWMDAASETFLEQLVDAVAGSSFFLLLNFRPEYSAGWMSKSYYRQIPLAPLGPEAVRELLDDLLGRDESVQDLAQAIHEHTGGNPFFTEEVVQNLIESGQLEGSRGSHRLVLPLERLEVPASVQALLAARIDRLGEHEKRVLQAAAVIGEEFGEPLLVAAGEEPAESVREALRVLEQGEFLYQRSLYPVAEYAFKHPLTQAVALGSQLKEQRRRTHGLVASALQQATAERPDETAALVAHHWEQAGDDAQAACWHQRAAQWAGSTDLPSSLHHWKRVRDLLASAKAEDEFASLAADARAQILSLGFRRGGAGEEECADLFAEGLEIAERAGDLASLVSLNAAYAAHRGVGLANMDDYVRYAEEAIRLADRAGDRSLRSGGRAQLAYALRSCGRLAECISACDETIELAAGDPHLGEQLGSYSPLIGARSLRTAAIALGGEPAAYPAAAAALKRLALDSGFPEMAVWLMIDQALFAEVLGEGVGAEARARESQELARNLGGLTQVGAQACLCSSLLFSRDWQAVRETAESTLREMRAARAFAFQEPLILDYSALALLGLGRLEEARARAAEAVRFMAETGDVGWRPTGWLTLARAQLELGEPAQEVERTLAQYETMIEKTGMRLLEDGLREMRARAALN